MYLVPPRTVTTHVRANVFQLDVLHALAQCGPRTFIGFVLNPGQPNQFIIEIGDRFGPFLFVMCVVHSFGDEDVRVMMYFVAAELVNFAPQANGTVDCTGISMVPLDVFMNLPERDAYYGGLPKEKLLCLLPYASDCMNSPSFNDDADKALSKASPISAYFLQQAAIEQAAVEMLLSQDHDSHASTDPTPSTTRRKSARSTMRLVDTNNILDHTRSRNSTPLYPTTAIAGAKVPVKATRVVLKQAQRAHAKAKKAEDKVNAAVAKEQKAVEKAIAAQEKKARALEKAKCAAEKEAARTVAKEAAEAAKEAAEAAKEAAEAAKAAKTDPKVVHTTSSDTLPPQLAAQLKLMTSQLIQMSHQTQQEMRAACATTTAANAAAFKEIELLKKQLMEQHEEYRREKSATDSADRMNHGEVRSAHTVYPPHNKSEPSGAGSQGALSSDHADPSGSCNKGMSAHYLPSFPTPASGHSMPPPSVEPGWLTFHQHTQLLNCTLHAVQDMQHLQRGADYFANPLKR